MNTESLKDNWFKKDKLVFKLINDGEAYGVEKCDRDAAGEIIIPQTVNGKPVTSIGGIAFMYCDKLTNVVIPEGITYIGNGAFQGCIGLKRIVIPESVTKIKDYAFEGCNLIIDAIGYTEWSFEDWSIGFTGFNSNIKINWKEKEIETADGLSFCLIDRTSAYEVHSCEKEATNVVIPKTHNGSPVIRIRDSAFKGCGNLLKVTIPDSITDIGLDAFEDTAIWEKADDKSIVYADKWAVGYKGKEGGMKGILTLKPDTVGISEYAFSEQAISDIVIPQDVKHIGKSAFYECKKLKNINVEEGNASFESNGYILRRTADKAVLAKSVINIYKTKKIDGEPLVFNNFNFKLAIIQVLMYEKELLEPKFDAWDFADSYQKRKINIEEEGYEPIKEIKKYFKDLAIDKKFAPEIEELNIDGGNEIYSHIIPFWDGEDDYYEVKSLSEKELKQFPNLKRITGTADFFSSNKVTKIIEANGIKKDF